MKTTAKTAKITNIAKRFGKLGKVYKQDKRAVWIDVPSKDIMKALGEVRKATERISDISIYDTGKGLLEVMYRFFISGTVLNIKTRINDVKPRINTAVRLFPGALLFEREQHEMFGVWFSGHPGLDKVLFAKTTPETPLRKKCILDKMKNPVKEEKDG